MSEKRRRVLRFIQLPVIFTAGYYLFENWRHLYTQGVKVISTTPIPLHLRHTVFSLFIKCFKVDAGEILEPLSTFVTFQDFFTRRVAPREIARRPGELYAPCDACVTEIRRVEDDADIRVKSVVYTLKKLITGEEGSFTPAEIRRDLHAPNEDLFAVSFYLAPGDYHRFHAPDDLRVRALSHIPGAMLSVNPFRKRIQVQLDGNERVVLDAQGRLGKVKMVFVAALGVGGIEVLDFRNFPAAFGAQARREVRLGDELGMFLLGSSILMLFSVPKGFQFSIAEGEHVRYGQPIGRCA